MITQRTIFTTSDGLDFDNLEKAKGHQTAVDLKSAFKEYQKGRPGGMSLTGFFDFIDRNRDHMATYIEWLNKAETGE